MCRKCSWCPRIGSRKANSTSQAAPCKVHQRIWPQVGKSMIISVILIISIISIICVIMIICRYLLLKLVLILIFRIAGSLGHTRVLSQSTILRPKLSCNCILKELLADLFVQQTGDICCCCFPSSLIICSRMKWRNTTEPREVVILHLWIRQENLSLLLTPFFHGINCIVAQLLPKCPMMSIHSSPWGTGDVKQ